MKTLLVIPARGGSKTIPRKNLHVVAGLPLIGYAIRNALAAKSVDRVIVSTEDAEIAEAARALGADVPFLRPMELATDEVSLIPVVQHAARAMAEDHGFDADIVASLQPTAPLLGADRIDAAVALLRDSGCCSVTSIQRIEQNHPYQALDMDADGRISRLFPEAERYLQKQDRPPFYVGTGGLYVRRRDVLDGWSGKDFCLGADRRAVVVTSDEGINIDTPTDMMVFEAVMAKKV